MFVANLEVLLCIWERYKRNSRTVPFVDGGKEEVEMQSTFIYYSIVGGSGLIHSFYQSNIPVVHSIYY